MPCRSQELRYPDRLLVLVSVFLAVVSIVIMRDPAGVRLALDHDHKFGNGIVTVEICREFLILE